MADEQFDPVAFLKAELAECRALCRKKDAVINCLWRAVVALRGAGAAALPILEAARSEADNSTFLNVESYEVASAQVKAMLEAADGHLPEADGA